ncbi:MAG: hypothetical protein RLZZ330_454 [Actinomycetota bacterium]|jgi:uncharacterized protein with FMN-binding domain
MRKSSARTAVVFGGALAGVTSTVAFGAQAALFPQADQNSALSGLMASPSTSASVNSGTTPKPEVTKKSTKKQKDKASQTPTPAATKTAKKHKKLNNGGGSTPTPTESTPTQSGPVDGTYVGSNAKALNFGYVKVQITVSGGQMTNIEFLSIPQRDSKSVELSNRALPQLVDAALSSQSASIGNVSGASWTTRAFKSSLAAAMTEAGL